MNPTLAYLAGMLHVRVGLAGPMHIMRCPCGCSTSYTLGTFAPAATLNLLLVAGNHGRGAQA